MLSVFEVFADGGPCPTYFCACCAEVKAGQIVDGARLGYDHPAYHLTIHLYDEQPYEVESDEWANAIDELIDFVQVNANEQILSWYNQWLPRCMAIVPRRRRQKFVEGVYQAASRHGWIDGDPAETT